MSTTGVLIYYDHPIWAFILLWISGYLDTVDGTMARQQRQSSAWGTVQDITFDRIVELSVIVGLATKFPEVQFMLLLLTASIDNDLWKRERCYTVTKNKELFQQYTMYRGITPFWVRISSKFYFYYYLYLC